MKHAPATPLTEAFVMREAGYVKQLSASACLDFARSLERDNARLREALSETVRLVYWRHTSEDKELRERMLALLSNSARAALKAAP